MSDAGAAAAQRYRESLRSKAERLGGGEDAQSVDSSSFSPGEPLNADAKTGMRPVSRQARKRGGVVHGEASPLGAHALARPGRAARKSGGGFGESYANRNMKEANEDREGRKHDMGLNTGGRAQRADGGITRDAGVFKADKERAGASKTRELKRETASQAVETRAAGGRVARQAGGPLASPLSTGMGGQGRLGFNFAGNRSQMLADGGRAKAHERYGAGPGPAEHHPGMAPGGRAEGGSVKSFSNTRGPDGRPIEIKGPPPAPVKLAGKAFSNTRGPDGRPIEIKDRASGGRAGRASGGAAPGPGEDVGTSDAGPLGAPGPGENKGAVGQESFHHRSPRGENSSRARTLATALEGAIDKTRDRYRKLLRAEGGKVGEGALKQHREEHKAMGAGEHPKGCTCAKCSGGEVKARAHGGRTKGKTNINIIIGAGAGQQPGGPQGPNPQLAIKPPAPPPMPMPMPGAAPPPGAPMPMPVPVPMGAGAGMPPPGMPPRARGGRAPKIHGEPEAGSGSGLGRLQKAAAYGHRSREGAGMRK